MHNKNVTSFVIINRTYSSIDDLEDNVIDVVDNVCDDSSLFGFYVYAADEKLFKTACESEEFQAIITRYGLVPLDYPMFSKNTGAEFNSEQLTTLGDEMRNCMLSYGILCGEIVTLPYSEVIGNITATGNTESVDSE